MRCSFRSDLHSTAISLAAATKHVATCPERKHISFFPTTPLGIKFLRSTPLPYTFRIWRRSDPSSQAFTRTSTLSTASIIAAWMPRKLHFRRRKLPSPTSTLLPQCTHNVIFVFSWSTAPPSDLPYSLPPPFNKSSRMLSNKDRMVSASNYSSPSFHSVPACVSSLRMSQLPSLPLFLPPGVTSSLEPPTITKSFHLPRPTFPRLFSQLLRNSPPLIFPVLTKKHHICSSSRACWFFEGY